MADDTFEIALQVSGEDKAARAFENLKLRELEAKQEATKLAAELRKLQASGSASAEQIEATSRSLIRAKQRAQEYAAQARRVQQAIRQQSNAQSVQAQGLDALGNRVGQTAGAFGNLGSVLGTVNPEFGKMGSAIGAVGTAFTGAVGAMGPMSLALAGITTAVTVGVSALNAYNEKLREQSERAQQAKDALDRLAVAMGDEARIQDLFAGLLSSEETGRQRDAAAARIAAIDATVEATARGIEGHRERLRELRADLEATTDPQGLGVMIRAVEETVERGTASLRRLRDERQGELTRMQALTEALGRARDREERERQRQSRRPTAAQHQARRDASEILRVSEQLGEDEVRIFRESREEMRRLELDHYATQLDAMRAFLDERRAMQRAETVWYRQELASRAELDREIDREIAEESRAMDREQREADAKKAEERTRLAQREKELAAITTNMWDSVGGTVTDAVGQMFRFVIEGAEGGSDAFLAMLDSFLEATSVEYTIKALAEVANAVAAAARQDYAAAAQHGIAAGLAAGVAAATGLASVAISVPTSPTSGGPSTPVSPAGPPGGNTNITVQLYAPQAIFTEAERAELLARGFREAERVRPGSARI